MRKVLLLLVLLLCSCRPDPNTLIPSPYIEVEEYVVYSALIQLNPVGYNPDSSILIRDQTFWDGDVFEQTVEKVRRLPARLVDSYRLRNGTSGSLESNLTVEQDYMMMSQEVFDEFFGKGGAGWFEFRTKYPDTSGFVVFSRVGFDAKGEKALVSMGYLCGDLCGVGGLYFLVKEDGSWKIKEELIVWMM